MKFLFIACKKFCVANIICKYDIKLSVCNDSNAKFKVEMKCTILKAMSFFEANVLNINNS